MGFNLLQGSVVWEKCSHIPPMEPYDAVIVYADFADPNIDWLGIAHKAPDYILQQYATKVHQPSWLLSVLGNYITHRLLAHYTEIESIHEQLYANEYGKPLIAHPSLHFNLSHTHQAALIGLAHSPLGVDVEWLHPKVDTALILPTIANQAEQNSVQLAENPLQAFYTLWTQKEAYLKAIGTGLTDDLPNVLQAEMFKTGDWTLKTFVLSPELIGATCVRHGTNLHYYKLTKHLLKSLNIL
jgi:phosphopantetheinyl transferase (holo-ACP synthase)